VREVEEETGMRCTLGREVGTTRYRDAKGRPKEVRYWLMELADAGEPQEFRPNNEIDELRWLSAAGAGKLLSYQHDRELVANAEALD
jgi:8-oxo-dGTP diphosphatase